MTEQATPELRLWTPEGFRDNEWSHFADAETAVASNARAILPLQVYLDLDPQFRADNAQRLAVVLQPGDALDLILEHLGRLPLVALAFPAFNDGRSFSKAELLRSRHSYAGAVRAVGQVLVDQLPHMLRVGFDEFEISNPVLLRRLQEGRIEALPHYYQPTAKAADAGPGYSWRRAPKS